MKILEDILNSKEDINDVVNDLVTTKGTSVDALRSINDLLNITSDDKLCNKLNDIRDALILRIQKESNSKFEAIVNILAADYDKNIIKEGFWDKFKKDKGQITNIDISDDELLDKISNDLNQPMSYPKGDNRLDIIFKTYPKDLLQKPITGTIPASSVYDERVKTVVKNLFNKQPGCTIKITVDGYPDYQKTVRKLDDLNDMYSEATKDNEKKPYNASPDSEINTNTDQGSTQEMYWYVLHDINPNLDYKKPVIIQELENGKKRAIVLNGIDLTNQKKGLEPSDDDMIYVTTVTLDAYGFREYGNIEKMPISEFKEILDSDINAQILDEFNRKNKMPTIEDLINSDKNRLSVFNKWVKDNQDELELDKYSPAVVKRIYRDITKFGYDPEDIPLRYNKKESIINEVSTNKPQSIEKDKYLVRKTLEDLRIDPIFMSVPIIKEAPKVALNGHIIPEEDRDPDERFVIIGFPDEQNLNRIKLADVDAPEGQRRTFEVTLDELRDLIKNGSPKNIHPKYDIIQRSESDYLRKAPLRQGLSGRYIDIPENVILTILDIMEQENPTVYPKLLEKYENNKTNPLVIKALKEFNDDPRTTIRAFKTKDGVKFKGFVPHDKFDITVRPPNYKNINTPLDKLLKY